MDGIALVEQSLVVELLEQPPQRLNIFIVVSDVRMIEVNPISHFLGQVSPLGSVGHDVLPAFLVVVGNGDIVFAFFVVDIGFGDTEFFLDTEFHRQSVGVPSSFPVHLESLHRLVAVEGVFDGSGQDMVYTGVSVG